VVFIVALLGMMVPGAVVGVAGVVAQEVPDLYTAETPLFHTSTSSDDRVSRIGRLYAARLLSPDRFVFVDLSLDWLVFVNADGGGVVTAGREGEGPREFRLPIIVGRSGDGVVVVWDALHRRMAIVAADGEFAEAPQYDRSVFASMKIQVAAGYADGTLVLTDDGFPIGLPTEGRREDGAFRDTVTFQTVVPDRPASTIARFAGPEHYLERQGSMGRMRGIIFGHKLHYAQVGQYLAVAQTDLDAVQVLDLSGAVVTQVPMPPPVPMSEDQIAAVRERIEERATAGAGRRSRPGMPEILSGGSEPFLFHDLPANNAAPAINRMLGDLDGRLWMRIFRPGAEAEHWQVWNIGGPTLEFALTLPEGEELLDAAGDRVLVRARDELDVEYVVLREIEGY